MIDQNILHTALREGYSVPAFNFSNFNTFKAIITTCERLHSPVVLQVSEGGLQNIGTDFVQCYLPRIQSSPVPCVLHLDHGKSLESVQTAIECGFSSVMYDGSALSYADNVAITKQICDYAHARGVVVESELGKIKGDDDNPDIGESSYTDPLTARDFVASTGTDSLAIAIGTNHGANKYAKNPKLRFDILSDIEREIPDVPLVLHGASLVEPRYVDIINAHGGDIHGAIGNGDALRDVYSTHICKINMDTDLRLAYTAGIREYLTTYPAEFDSRKYEKAGMQYLCDVIADRIINICHSNDRF